MCAYVHAYLSIDFSLEAPNVCFFVVHVYVYVCGGVFGCIETLLVEKISLIQWPQLLCAVTSFSVPENHCATPSPQRAKKPKAAVQACTFLLLALHS